MRNTLLLFSGTLVLQCAFAGLPIPGDASRGAQVFKDQKCITCHSVNGVGGKSATDLGKQPAGAYTPNTMVSRTWNGAPQMWAAIEKLGLPKPRINTEQVADLFAYCAAARQPDKPGNATAGKSLFASKQCAACHSADSIKNWQSVNDPIALAQAMWNHAKPMAEAMAKKKIVRPTLSAAELTDILAYLRPLAKGTSTQTTPASAETGKELFRLKGCVKCHSGAGALDDKYSNRTMTDLAAALWNHGQKGNAPPSELRAEEMRRIVGYLWSIQYFEPKGDAARGRSVYRQKLCVSCHDDPEMGAPVLKSQAGKFSGFSLTASLWEHGGGMLSRMVTKNVSWRRFTAVEMADLIAHLNNPK